MPVKPKRMGTRLLAYRLKFPRGAVLPDCASSIVEGMVILRPMNQPPSPDLWERCPWLDQPKRKK